MTDWSFRKPAESGLPSFYGVDCFVVRVAFAVFVLHIAGEQASQDFEPMPGSHIPKPLRIHIRTDLPTKLLLADAARSCDTSLSAFLLDAGICAANQMLADRNRFELEESRWQEFQQILDRPVTPPDARLNALMKEKGVLG